MTDNPDDFTLDNHASSETLKIVFYLKSEKSQSISHSAFDKFATMRWKKGFSGIFLFLTLLHCALCNRQSHEKISKKGEDDSRETAIVPGPETAILQSGHIVHLDNMSFLDPYNMMASMKRDGQDDSKSQSRNPKKAFNGSSTQTDLETTHTTRKNRQPPNSDSVKDDRQNSSKSSSSSISSSSSAAAATTTTADENDNVVPGAHKTPPEQSPFGDNDFDVYDEDYNDFDSDGTDFDILDVRKGRRKKWNKRYHERNALLHEAVRKLLGFSQSPNAVSKHRRLLPDPNREDKLPRYVKDLYERFQSGEMSAGLAKGNTVRSIHGSIGEIEGKSMFLFNLSSLRSSERLLNAEIHLYKRRLRHKLQPLDIEVRLHQVASRKTREAGKIVMRDSGFGWQWYDVSTAVKNCLTPKKHSLFALSFRANKPNGKSKLVSLRKFGRHHSMPFLVLYSNETEAANFDQLDLLADRLWKRRDYDLKSPADGRVLKDKNSMSAGRRGKAYREGTRHTTNPSRNEINYDSEEADPLSLSTSSQRPVARLPSRDKRSIYTNEIPEGPVMDFKRMHYHNKIPHKIPHPAILKTRKETRVGFDNRGLLPVSDRHVGVHRRRRKKHKNRKHRRGRLAFPKDWGNQGLRKNVEEKDGGEGVCGRRKLTVDFGDIGWGDWIISPKSFDAHYCSGSCPFPIMKNLRPSNHATIQSIVHAIGIYNNVPAPCCVPDAMSSVTLLYFDEDRNVVLKNYPGMTVDSCACH